jgi:acyl-CoA reductase-like NAD-dependent aldehyde dehydrogenase
VARGTAEDVEKALDAAHAAAAWENGKACRETNTIAYHFHEPLGVVGQIIPWLRSCWSS